MANKIHIKNGYKVVPSLEYNYFGLICKYDTTH